MNLRYTLFIALSICFNLHLHSQSTCTYTLQLFDQFGDGWSGSEVRITSGESTMTYTLDGESDNGIFRVFDISLTDGETLSIDYASASNFEADNSYILFNPEGIEVFKDGVETGQSPTAGTVFEGTVECPACLVVNPSSVSIVDVRATTAEISWNPTDPEGTYQIETGLRGFTPGSGTINSAAGRSILITGLTENTSYDFYVSVNCASGDISRTIGPFNFKTLWKINVGVTEIVGPETKCEIGSMDSVKVVLKNFGGDPQSLIPFRYSVNGVDAGVPIPNDGFYTGVLGKDSMVEIAFETLYDFTTPGEYLITAWTELEGDSLIFNDTASLKITNIPVITNYPYFENFESLDFQPGGWTVDPESKFSSWAFGAPKGNAISNAASGIDAWVTNVAGLHNNSEFSVLLSPCLDFSTLTEDPNLGFSINFDSEACCDEAWVEVSIDGGITWNKVGASGTGVNWYNDDEQQWWDGDGGFNGWVKASNTLTGTAGQPEVRVRIIFSSDFQIAKEGIGIDDVFITPQLDRDLAGISIQNSAASECGSSADQVVFTVANLGDRLISNFDLSYRVNDEAIITQNSGSVSIAPGTEQTFTFDATFDSSTPGEYEVVAWTSLGSDAFVRNDTARIKFATAVELPFGEDFEGRFLPIGWSVDEDVQITMEHQNTSVVLSNNLYQGDQSFEANTPVIGPIQLGDSLYFDYRITDLNGDGTIATELGPGDMLAVQVSTDCGETFGNTVFLIDTSNHVATTELTSIGISLDEFAGGYIKIKFLGSWGTGDYYFDLDNVFIPRCTGSLGLIADVTNISSNNAADGSISLTPTLGAPPYSYSWDNGSKTSSLSGLVNGIYQVTVTDRFGCSESLALAVDIGVNAVDTKFINEFKVFPNPATDIISVNVELPQAQQTRVQILNIYGQVIYETLPEVITRQRYDIDAKSYPSGVYLVRISLADQRQFFTKKLIKN